MTDDLSDENITLVSENLNNQQIVSEIRLFTELAMPQTYLFYNDIFWENYAPVKINHHSYYIFQYYLKESKT